MRISNKKEIYDVSYHEVSDNIYFIGTEYKDTKYHMIKMAANECIHLEGDAYRLYRKIVDDYMLMFPEQREGQAMMNVLRTACWDDIYNKYAHTELDVFNTKDKDLIKKFYKKMTKELKLS